MRLAVISDIHANLAALEAVLDDIETKSPDAIINLGDCVSGPLWPRETMELLEARGIPSVRGNHDRWLSDRPVERLAASDRFALGSLGEDWAKKLYELPATMDVNGALWPRLCQNTKSLGFRVSLYPSRSATKPTQSVLTSRDSR